MSGDSYFVDRLKDTVASLLSNERIDFRFDNLLSIGNGYNDFAKGIFQRRRFILVIGNDGFDESSPRSCFELAQAVFHEARHVMHHVERMQGNHSELLDKFTFAYLAREQNDKRYELGYSDNIFELDANAYSVVAAKRFCEQFFPNANFDEIACDVWQKRCESMRTRFVTNWEGLSSVEDIATHMRFRIMIPDCDNHISICRRGDAVWDYLHNKASDTFCDLWREADSDFVRDKLCAAALVGSGFSSALYPNVDMLDWYVGDVDVLADVWVHQNTLGTSRSELAWSSESDVLQSLASAIESGLSLSSSEIGPFDHVSINRHGIVIEHRGFDWAGPRHESEPMCDHTVEVALDGLADGSLVPFSGEVPDLVCERVGRTFSYVEPVSYEQSSSASILLIPEMCIEDNLDTNGFDFEFE